MSIVASCEDQKKQIRARLVNDGWIRHKADFLSKDRYIFYIPEDEIGVIQFMERPWQDGDIEGGKNGIICYWEIGVNYSEPLIEILGHLNIDLVIEQIDQVLKSHKVSATPASRRQKVKHAMRASQ